MAIFSVLVVAALLQFCRDCENDIETKRRRLRTTSTTTQPTTTYRMPPTMAARTTIDFGTRSYKVLELSSKYDDATTRTMQN
mmetsp:Transcript_34/g.173  ORF Transcript_34/g.173 Transcript_34/m.173 type:complete len:82 (+) Transcript_34:1665-1910(+)